MFCFLFFIFLCQLVIGDPPPLTEGTLRDTEAWEPPVSPAGPEGAAPMSGRRLPPGGRGLWGRPARVGEASRRAHGFPVAPEAGTPALFAAVIPILEVSSLASDSVTLEKGTREGTVAFALG